MLTCTYVYLKSSVTLFLAVLSPQGHQGRSTQNGQQHHRRRFGSCSRGRFCFGSHHSWKPVPLAFPMDSNVRVLKELQRTTVHGCGAAWEDACPSLTLGCCSPPHHLCRRWGVCSWGRFAKLGCICCIFVKPFAQPAANILTRMISYFITHN